MSSPNTVTVKNIAAATSDKEVKDFFSFCGKITDIQVEAAGEAKSAVVTFEKDTAAKTALLLNNTQLGANHISVTGTAVVDEQSSSEKAAAAAPVGASSTGATDGAPLEHELTQEEKPRARIFAEYLAHGYVIGDAALQRAIELDHKHNVSTRFATKLTALDSKYHATEKAKAADQSYNLTGRASSLLTGFNSYFEKASASPNGQRVVDFYTTHQKKVQDIHNEARRLAGIKKTEAGGSAYKAAGLEKIFGAEKKADGASAASTTTTAAEPAAAAAPTATTTTTEPKFDPPPTAPSA